MTGRRIPPLRRLLRRTGPRPRPSRREWIFDAAVAIALGGAALLANDPGDVAGPTRFEVIDGAEPRAEPGTDMPVPPDPPARPHPWPPFLPSESSEPPWLLVLLLVLVPLLFRRRFPLAVLWAVMVTAPLLSESQAALRLSFYACLIAGYSAAVYSPFRVPALASLPLAAAVYSAVQSETIPAVPNEAVPFLILLPIAVVAAGLWRWRRRSDEDRARLSEVERDQVEALRRATEQERARIARELHDVVTHNVSVMVIQAGAARKVMGVEPGQAREALLAVEASGRAAMTELRHAMGLLTMDDQGPDADLAPQPGLDRLEELTRRVREAGLPVDLIVTGTPRPLSPGVELTGYRLVQEALTNTVRHAPGASATVTVEYGERDLRIEVVDTGGGPGALSGTGSGRGLIGLRERLAIYGATLDAGPRPSGGFRVRATIPDEEATIPEVGTAAEVDTTIPVEEQR